jgi:hypothetical protein
MSAPDTNMQPADQAMADVAAALMACYNPTPLPAAPAAAAPLAGHWTDETPAQHATLRLLDAAFNG